MSKSELRRLEIVAPDAIKQLREQIAREIEEMPLGDVQAWQIVRSRAAAIARGEPNQVTKDAIEEARKMNDPR